MAYQQKNRDLKWARRIKDGDNTAFEAMFCAYAEKLCSFAEQYVKSPAVAEEIVQDLFLEIWRDREQWSPRKNVRAYLYRTVRNAALDYLKHEEVVAAWKKEAGVEKAAYRSSPAEDLDRKELGRAIQDAVEQLPRRQRTAFILSRRHDMTYREVAETLDISIKTVETHMHRAFESLREILAHYTRER